MNKKTVYFLTVSRSDFLRYLSIFEALDKYKNINKSFLVSGSHYSKTFGLTYKDIKNSKYNSIKAINNKYIEGKNSNFSLNISSIMNSLSRIFSKKKPDFLVILGDRYEMISGSLVALEKQIPVIHIHGGAVTFGAIDDMIRHSITKLSHIHLVSHEIYRNRIIQLGEEKWRIKNVGAPGLDHLKNNNILDKKILSKKININPDLPYILVCIHPETQNLKEIELQINNLIKVLKQLDMKQIITYPNSDPGSDIIIKNLKNYCKNNNKTILIKNAGSEIYYALLKNTELLLGNSSSGIVEAPSFKIPVINLGIRQQGKIMSKNIINSSFKIKEIKISISKARSINFKKSLRNIKNPYGDGRAGIKIAKIINSLNKTDKLMQKKFEDI